jgi:hypothetical protein
VTVATFAEPFPGGTHDDFTAWAREVREYRIERAYDRPQIKLYDGEWVYRGTVYGEISGNLIQTVNQPGLISVKLPIDQEDPRRTWAAFWALDEESRGTSNIHITVETNGARIGGRMKSKNGVTVTRDAEGDFVQIDFLDDVAELQFVHTAGNPFLPLALIQQPKAWMLLLQADYAILLTMACEPPTVAVDQLGRLRHPRIVQPGELDSWLPVSHLGAVPDRHQTPALRRFDRTVGVGGRRHPHLDLRRRGANS